MMVGKNGEVHVQLNIKLKGLIEEYTGSHPLTEESIVQSRVVRYFDEASAGRRAQLAKG
ncbi:hypothetical protein VQ056_13720 [Paenibacillus sp. JTLBN-2024]